MSRTYTIDLESSLDCMQPYEVHDNNIGKVSVILSSGELIEDRNCLVQFFLSRDGMLGLGTELIRLAHQVEQGQSSHCHLDPIADNFIVESLGIYLTPDSCRLMIDEDKFPVVDNLINSHRSNTQ